LNCQQAKRRCVLNIRSFIQYLEKKVLGGESLCADEAVQILKVKNDSVFDLLASSDRIRRAFKGKKISLCSIINARSGKCPEDCAFCAQSALNRSDVPEYGLVNKETVLDSAKSAVRSGARKFGIVTSGRGIGLREDSGKICEFIDLLKKSISVHRCASLGILKEEELRQLMDAGLEEYHHNLETSRSFFPEICTTHDYEDNVSTVRLAKKVGLRTCCGGIFGMGESDEQRVEFACTLRELDVDSVPINFLNPMPGTRMENREILQPLEGLKIIALFRFMLPEKDIKMAGGREVVLKDLQPLMFAAGANSTMLGNYLTTKGRQAEDDLTMIKDLELEMV